MIGGVVKVEEMIFGEYDDIVVIREFKAVVLRFDVLAFDVRVRFEVSYVDFVVEVIDVIDDGVVFYFFYVLDYDDVFVICGGDEDVDLVDDVFDRGDLVIFYGGLERVNRVDFRYDDVSVGSFECGGGIFIDIIVVSDLVCFGCDYDVSGVYDIIR